HLLPAEASASWGCPTDGLPCIPPLVTSVGAVPPWRPCEDGGGDGPLAGDGGDGGGHGGTAPTDVTRAGIHGKPSVGHPQDAEASAGSRWLVNRLGQVLGVAVVLTILAGTTYAASRSLNAYYFDPKYGRDDYRGLARYLDAAARPGDAIVLNAPSQSEIFGYYYKGPLPVLPIPGQRPLDERVTADDLKQAGAKYRRIWVVFWADKESDPGSFVEGWLNQNAFRASNKWFGNVRLVLYGLPSTTSAGTVQQQVEANFGDKVSLLGYSLHGAKVDTDFDARPGEVLQLTLYWQALSKIDQRYTVFTHLVDPHEHIWGQRDAEPGSGAKPTTGWVAGAVISDNYGIPVVYGTPPGEYYVEAGIYQPATGQRLPLLGQGGTTTGDRILFGPLRVGKAANPPTIASLNAKHPASSDFGPLRLVGYDFGKLGSEQEVTAFGQGDIARLALFWQATDKPGRDYNVTVRLLDANGRVAFAKQNPPADGNYPTGLWDKGEIVLDQHKIPMNLPPGKYRLTVGIEDGKTRPADLGEVVITGGKGK
ncbi:MAG: hypothetical protein Q7O66_02285, partial [Dehalococcoidia bacterium]|nr:hypothetical protein [Dehalococcoidia bacterium]